MYVLALENNCVNIAIGIIEIQSSKMLCCSNYYKIIRIKYLEGTIKKDTLDKLFKTPYQTHIVTNVFNNNFYIELCKRKDYDMLMIFANLNIIINDISQLLLDNLDDQMESTQFLLLAKIIDNLKKYNIVNYDNICLTIYKTQNWNLFKLLIKTGLALSENVFKIWCQDKSMNIIKYSIQCNILYFFENMISIIQETGFFEMIAITDYRKLKSEQFCKLLNIMYFLLTHPKYTNSEQVLMCILINNKNDILMQDFLCLQQQIICYILMMNNCHNKKICKLYFEQVIHENSLIVITEKNDKGIIEDYCNFTLWKPKYYHILSFVDKSTILTMLLCHNKITKQIKQKMPKPITCMIINMIIL
jgi:hypothetical protein